MKRQIIKIDENKCNGCGQCVPNCAEGAIQIIDGKARLVSDLLCDGLGACLGHCPEGAITIEERDAAPYDAQHVAMPKAPPPAAGQSHCPGMRMMDVPRAAASHAAASSPSAATALQQWPVQLRLLQPQAPFFANADLLIAADCVPFALADFHARLLHGKVLIVFCPKLDPDLEQYVEKLAAIFRAHSIRSITVAHMEVPCCSGVGRVLKAALQQAGVQIPVTDITITLQGEQQHG